MTAIGKFRESMAGPTVILLAICLVITFALAFVNQVTAPVIEAGQIAAANAVRARVLPGGGAFTELTGIPLPDGVSEAYQADNGSGFVFRSAAKGFGGNVTYMIGIDASGNVTGIEMFSHNETPGLGTKVADENFLGAFYGAADPDEPDGITGATRTTESLRNSLKQAKAAYELVKGAA
jgi:electron transport complex protein RnfG